MTTGGSIGRQYLGFGGGMPADGIAGDIVGGADILTRYCCFYLANNLN